jgi:hypothetical protein
MSLPPGLVQLRADLLRRVAEFRGPAVPPPSAPDAAPLRSALEAAGAQVDPVPRPPFASHRTRGAGLVGAMKGAVALVLRPLTRLLFQRQAALNLELVRTSSLLAEQVRALAEASARQGEQAEAWTHDLRRAREERLLVLDTLTAMAEDLRRLEERVEELSHRMGGGPTRP